MFHAFRNVTSQTKKTCKNQMREEKISLILTSLIKTSALIQVPKKFVVKTMK